MAIHMATIPVAIHTILGKVIVTNEIFADEITQFIKKIPEGMPSLSIGKD